MPDGVGTLARESLSQESNGSTSISTSGFAGPVESKPPTAREKPYGTLVYSEGQNLTLIKGKTPSELATLISSAQESNVPFVMLAGVNEPTGRVWVAPESVTALIFCEMAS
jgi:hypothetical protein